VELTDLDITVIKNGIFPSNTYILKAGDTNECILIDPGLDRDLIEQTIDEKKCEPIAVLATHGHFDHIGSAAFFKEKLNIPYYLHAADLKLSKSANFYLKIARIKLSISITTPDVLFTGFEQNITIGQFKFNIYNYPGHSDGSCIIQYNNILFSGDILYKNGLGFNNFPGENKGSLKKSILQIIDKFPGNALIVPGHGGAEELGLIVKNNQELISFINDEQ
jgi:hydroxyacylglutathione hydrolase